MNSFLLPVAFWSHVLVSFSSKKKVDIQLVPKSTSRSALPWSTEPMKQGVKLTCEMKDTKGKKLDQRLLLEILCNRIRYLSCYLDPLQYVDICWFCTDDEIIVDMAASISKRTPCCRRKTKSSTQHSSNIWCSIIVHTWCLRLWWVKSWWQNLPNDKWISSPLK